MKLALKPGNIVDGVDAPEEKVIFNELRVETNPQVDETFPDCEMNGYGQVSVLNT